MRQCLRVCFSRPAYLNQVRYGSTSGGQKQKRQQPQVRLNLRKFGHVIQQKARDTRADFLSSDKFHRWLQSHLTSQANKTEDKSFADFLKTLCHSIRKLHARSSRRLGEDEDVAPVADAEEASRLVQDLKNAYLNNGEESLDARLQFAFHGHVITQKLSKTAIKEQRQIADLRYPIEWYPATRAIQRTIYLHVGPTNSGKTFHALEKLETATTGVYAGPLRLLAHEVYGRLNAKGKACSLVTGDERIINPDSGPNATMISCTVEMIPLDRTFDVAVIDEIQMIGDDYRGWAWTQALLGLRAKELHLCGEERTVPLIRDLVASMGDKLIIRTYKRLTPLTAMSSSLHGSLKELKKGDCVVVFSRMGIHAMKQDIERATERRVAIIYGSLPPEIRAQQAKLFNDPESDYDILVASDAIGMGLNLSVFLSEI